MKLCRIMVLMAVVAALGGCKSQKATVRRVGEPHRTVVSRSEMPAAAMAGRSSTVGDVDRRLGEALVGEARTWLGTPYVYGGETKKGADCSGMLMTIFRDIANLSLPRNSAAMRQYCLEIGRKDLQKGDLVFFSSSKGRGKVSHVGMYAGLGRIIHASSSRGVIESSLDEKYYSTHYHSSGRVPGVMREVSVKSVPATPPEVKSEAPAITLEEFERISRVKTEVIPDSVVAKPASPAIPVASAATDSVARTGEIRETVVKAMKFGK